MRGLYIHIPFCVKKCSYCDFVSFGGRENFLSPYLNRIEKEAQLYKGEKIDTVFIGGGTPSLMNGEQMHRLFEIINDNFSVSENAEITAECNPQSVNFTKMQEYKKCGINRISMGAQSLSDEVLGELGRCHTLKQLENAIEDIKATHFSSFNLDLIFALPNQTVSMWQATLAKLLTYEPDHVSCYSLTVEPNTPLGKAVLQGKIQLPDEEVERRMYYSTKEMLHTNGIEQYEISNYAKKGFECKHNINYWQCGEYIGLGCAAHSYYKGARYSNTKNLDEYFNCDSSAVKKDILTADEMAEERIMLGLRMNKGVNIDLFQKDFGIDFEEKYEKPIKKFKNIGFIQIENGYMFLTDKGRDFCDTVALEFAI